MIVEEKKRLLGLFRYFQLTVLMIGTFSIDTCIPTFIYIYTYIYIESKLANNAIFYIIFPWTRMSLFHWFTCATWLPSKSLCKFLCTAIWRNHNPIFEKQIGVLLLFYVFTIHPCWGPLILIGVAALCMTSCCVCN